MIRETSVKAITVNIQKQIFQKTLNIFTLIYHVNGQLWDEKSIFHSLVESRVKYPPHHRDVNTIKYWALLVGSSLTIHRFALDVKVNNFITQSFIVTN